MLSTLSATSRCCTTYCRLGQVSAPPAHVANTGQAAVAMLSWEANQSLGLQASYAPSRISVPGCLGNQIQPIHACFGQRPRLLICQSEGRLPKQPV